MLGVGRSALSVRSCRFALVRREEISSEFERELLWSCERRLVSVEVDIVPTVEFGRWCKVGFDKSFGRSHE